MILWDDAPPNPPSVLTTTESDCAWSGGVCLTRASLKRTVHEMQEAVYAKGLSERALSMAERRYHQALTELMEHHCGEHDSAPDGVRITGCGVATASRQDGPTSPPLSPPDIADFEKLIDRVCALYARKGMADIAEEYRDARLVLRTRILMLMANQRTTLIDILEANERGV